MIQLIVISFLVITSILAQSTSNNNNNEIDIKYIDQSKHSKEFESLFYKGEQTDQKASSPSQLNVGISTNADRSSKSYKIGKAANESPNKLLSPQVIPRDLLSSLGYSLHPSSLPIYPPNSNYHPGHYHHLAPLTYPFYYYHPYILGGGGAFGGAIGSGFGGSYGGGFGGGYGSGFGGGYGGGYGGGIGGGIIGGHGGGLWGAQSHGTIGMPNPPYYPYPMSPSPPISRPPQSPSQCFTPDHYRPDLGGNNGYYNNINHNGQTNAPPRPMPQVEYRPDGNYENNYGSITTPNPLYSYDLRFEEKLNEHSGSSTKSP